MFDPTIHQRRVRRLATLAGRRVERRANAQYSALVAGDREAYADLQRLTRQALALSLHLDRAAR